MAKKLFLLALCVIFSMFFFVSCVDDEEEDIVDTETGNASENTDQNGDSNGENNENTSQNDNENNDENKEENNSQPAENDNNTEINDNNTETPDTSTEEPDTNNETPDNNIETPDDNETTDSDPIFDGDDSNLNNGDTSGNQAQTGAVGAACSNDNNCKGSYGSGDSEQILVCLTANDSYFPAPDGYCTFFCDMTDSSACSNANGICYGYGSWGDGYCFHKCSKPSDCRVGYRCSNKIHACMPDCVKNGCVTGKCDETDGVCLK